MSSEDLEGTNSPSLSHGNKSNGATFSDCDQTDENLISSPTVSDSIKSVRKTFGWCGYQPKCFQNLLSAKWALFWLCWAGAVQGKFMFLSCILGISHLRKLFNTNFISDFFPEI